MASADHEGLQVNHQAGYYTGPEHIAYDKSYPQVLHYSDKEVLHAVAAVPGERSGGKMICGLSRALLIGLAVFGIVVIAAAVGGGVGGAMAVNSRKSSSNNEGPSSSSSISAATPPSPPTLSTGSSGLTTSSTSTTPSASATATSGMGTYNCPSDNDTTYTSPVSTSLKLTYTRLCDLDFVVGTESTSGLPVVDLRSIIATSLEACIDQCAVDYSQGISNCTAVSYGANITLALSRGGIGGNCFLKDSRSANPSVDNSGQLESAFMDT